MAKVLISIPDDLLRRLDEHAEGNDETRSGFLQRTVAKAVEEADGRVGAEIKELLDRITYPSPGTDVAQLIREDRESH